MFCFDTDVLSALLKRDPPLGLVRRIGSVPAANQFTTAITMGEMLCGAARRGSSDVSERVRILLSGAIRILPFDEHAAAVYGSLRATLEAGAEPLAEPDLRISAIALSQRLTLVTGNTRHFRRVPGLALENWLEL